MILSLQAKASIDEVSLHEPVFVDCILFNRNTKVARLDLGPGRIEAYRIAVKALRHSSIGEYRTTRSGFAASGEVEIAPLAEHREPLLLQDWYRFEEPDGYLITIALLLDGERISSEPFVLDVLPRDADRLRAVCEVLAERAVSGGVSAEAVDAARALAHVADPVAIPFLESLLAGNSVMRYQAIEGLGRIDDPAARALLEGLTRAKNKETVLLARQALRGGKGSGIVAD